ncbi:oligosaccharide flippase family protein [Desulfogranum marinum]|uniref:oligosaccharide flippase family protein n=1 Tax=Desulfogranum marinum TaxID=453220 RepID=UPI0029C815CD|nr:oligosaccharide flippase family protein [Desulfogranum marinum]
MTTTNQLKAQFPRNLLLQIISFCTQVSVGLYLVPYLVHNLGPAAFGLIPIAGMLTQYVSLISQSLSSAVNRYLTIAIQRNDFKDASAIFSTAFFSCLVIGLVQIPFFSACIYYADLFIDIPEDILTDAFLLLIFSAATFIMNLLTGIFSVPLYALNRIDLIRIVDILRSISRFIGILIIFYFFTPSLRYVGYVYFVISVFLCILTRYISYKLSPQIFIKLSCFQRNKVKSLVGMSSWLLINQIGTLLFLQMDVWVCNRFVGAVEAGKYAAVLQWSTLIRQGGAIVGAVASPMIMIYFAKKDIYSIVKLSLLSLKALSLFLVIPISIICYFSSSLLELWLGVNYAKLSILMIVMVSHLVINVGVLPLFSIQVALEKVKLPAMLTLIMGIINLLLAIFFAKYLDLGIFGVATATALVLTTKNAIFTPIYVAKILNKPWFIFFEAFLPSLVLASAILLLCYIINFVLPVHLSWMHLFFVSILIGAIGSLLAWFLLSKQDRKTIRSLPQLQKNRVK